MAQQKLISMSELAQKKVFTAWVGKEEVMAVITTQGVRVYSGMCPHQGGPLGEGVFQADKVTCPWHGCTYDLLQGGCTDTGVCRNVSAGMKLKPLPFSVGSDQNLYVETTQ